MCACVRACVCAATEHAWGSEHNWQELPLCFHRGVVGMELKSPGLVARDFAKPNRPESFLEDLLSSVVSVEHRPAERTCLGCFNVLWPFLKNVFRCGFYLCLPIWGFQRLFSLWSANVWPWSPPETFSPHSSCRHRLSSYPDFKP